MVGDEWTITFIEPSLFMNGLNGNCRGIIRKISEGRTVVVQQNGTNSTNSHITHAAR